MIKPNEDKSAEQKESGWCRYSPRTFRRNPWYRCQPPDENQDRGPIAADIERIKGEKSKSNEATFALTADATEAHREVAISRQDWHLQVQPGGDVFVNTVGTFGVASASCYWSRVASAVGRLCQYVPGPLASTWHLLVADDYHLDAGGPEYRGAINCFFVFCSVIGVPLSWRKTAGGDTVSWVGFELLQRSYKIGLSERRAQWFQRWTRETALSGCVRMSAFEECIGRVVYVTGALEFERPLSALYRFLTELISSDIALRVDAQASEGRTGVGRSTKRPDLDGSVWK